LQFAYPEDVRMWGLSFNTTVAETSLSGELAFRPNQPILKDSLDNVFSMLQAQSIGTVGVSTGLGNGGTATFGQVDSQTVAANSGYIEVWDRKDIINGSLLAINNFGPVAGFDDFWTLFEVSFSHVGGLGSDDKFRDALGAVRAVANPEDPNHTGSSITPFSIADEYISSTSWGYTAVLSGQWNSVVPGVVLNPMITYSEDVSGNSYQGGNFVEDRKSMTLELNAVYLKNLEAGVSYTEFWDAGLNNLMRDRDNVSMTVKYSF